MTDQNTGEPIGRRNADGSVSSWPTRSEIESSGMLGGTELVWVEDDLDAYIIHVNGSARLRMDNGDLMYIGYAGKTDKPYTGLGKSLMDAGMISSNDISLRKIQRLYDKDPTRIKNHINKMYGKLELSSRYEASLRSLGARAAGEPTTSSPG